MPEIILGILFYLIASTIHILKYRSRKIGQAGILKAFGVFLLFLPAVYLVSIFLPVRWPLSTVLFYLLLSGTHFIFFTSPYLGDEGPSSKIYFLLKNKGQLDFKKLLIYFGIPGIIASAYGASLIVHLPEKLSSIVVGIILVSYVIFLLLEPNFKLKENNFTASLGGITSGFLAGISGVGGGALRAVVLTAFNIPKSTYIFTAGVLGALIDASRIFTYFVSGTRIEIGLFLGFIFFIPASFMGAEIAKKFVYKIPQKFFRKVIALFLLLLGIKLILFP